MECEFLSDMSVTEAIDDLQLISKKILRTDDLRRRSFGYQSPNMLSQKNIQTNRIGNQGSEEIYVHRHHYHRSMGGNGTPHCNKMSKKQIKLAQAQLEKLTQTSKHLHGTLCNINNM